MRVFTLISAIIMGSIATADEVEAWKEQGSNFVQGEQKVVGAEWSQSFSFWVFVADDGTSQDRYARYMCKLLDVVGRPEGEFVAVTVWDAATITSSRPKKLGKANCD